MLRRVQWSHSVGAEPPAEPQQERVRRQDFLSPHRGKRRLLQLPAPQRLCDWRWEQKPLRLTHQARQPSDENQDG